MGGDAVNVASRMKTNCSPGGIQLTDETYHQLTSNTNWDWVSHRIEVKGKGLMNVKALALISEHFQSIADDVLGQFLEQVSAAVLRDDSEIYHSMPSVYLLSP
eukprot:NODE_2880_length_454_cov_123.143210_g2282_i0.p1 GENE.NODE_2880_length_454_cov_123.143210_g2282_i0~~NODE_2880_length_454_cov_123.143210_g2282_i0.p1  ORF type:complete len:103 (-),score=11.64 NODE_2880_length_454_cov_123.143210_g2282_i0:117-425(-)